MASGQSTYVALAYQKYIVLIYHIFSYLIFIKIQLEIILYRKADVQNVYHYLYGYSFLPFQKF